MNLFMQILLVALLAELGCLSIFKTFDIGGDIATTIEVYAGGDKMLHFWGAGAIAFMVCYIFRHRFCPNRIAFWVMSLLLVEEGSQAIFPNRHFNLDDIGAGCVGVLLFTRQDLCTMTYMFAAIFNARAYPC